MGEKLENYRKCILLNFKLENNFIYIKKEQMLDFSYVIKIFIIIIIKFKILSC